MEQFLCKQRKCVGQHRVVFLCLGIGVICLWIGTLKVFTGQSTAESPIGDPIDFLASRARALIAMSSDWLWLPYPMEWVELGDLVGEIFISPESFRQWIQGYGARAPAVFFLMQVVQVIVAPLPGGVFPSVGTVIFGPWPTLALSLSGTAIGSAIVFTLARRWGRPLVLRLVGQETTLRYERIVAAQGGLWFFLVFLLPVPGDALCAIAGLSTLSFGRFMILTTFGRLPSTALSIFIVSNLVARPAWVWLAAAAMIVASLLLVIGYRTRLESWLVQQLAAGRTEGDGKRVNPMDRSRADKDRLNGIEGSTRRCPG